MYKSPIDIIYQELDLQIEKCAKQLDEDIYKAVMQYDIIVDEKELIRAMNYDRNQYEKGYADGKADAMASIVRREKCEHGIWEEENRMWQCVRCAEFDEKSGMFFGFSEYHNGNHFCGYGERREGE